MDCSHEAAPHRRAFCEEQTSVKFSILWFVYEWPLCCCNSLGFVLVFSFYDVVPSFLRFFGLRVLLMRYFLYPWTFVLYNSSIVVVLFASFVVVNTLQIWKSSSNSQGQSVVYEVSCVLYKKLKRKLPC